MTKGEVIELIRLQVTAGKPNHDSTVKWMDIEVFMPSIFAYYMYERMRIDKRENRGDGMDGSSIDPAYLATIEINLHCEKKSGLHFVDLPVR